MFKQFLKDCMLFQSKRPIDWFIGLCEWYALFALIYSICYLITII